ncbi:MAG: glycosyltransferase [Oscillospiraceae bacterium]|nr:glycosyltransferase [Oscillospiraceae bacterium]
MIRVLQVVTQMNRAGLESRLMDIYRNINREYVQFDFYTFRKKTGYFDDEIKSLGGRVYYNDPISVSRMCQVTKIVHDFLLCHPEYKIIHAHMNQWCGIILKGAKKARLPIRIAHSRTALGKHSIKNTVKNIIKLSTNKYATHKFAVSHNTAIWLYGKNSNATVWPNSIDSQKFCYNAETRARIRAELDMTNKYVLIHVGNMRPVKNHMFIIDVFERLKQKKPNSKMVFIGADHMDGYVQAYAETKKTSNDILFMGARSDVNEIMQAGDVFVFPSFYEGFSGTIIEAQTAGLPCIISDTITHEVCLTDHIVQVPINKGVEPWVEQILQFESAERVNNYQLVCEKGYDVFTLCDNLEKFYLTCT